MSERGGGIEVARGGQAVPALPPGAVRRIGGTRYSVSRELLEAVALELRRPTSDRGIALARAIVLAMGGER